MGRPVYCTGGFTQPRLCRLAARLWRTRQAIDIDPHGACAFQQPRQCLSGGAGGQYIVYECHVTAVNLRFIGHCEGVAKVAVAVGGIQLLL